MLRDEKPASQGRSVAEEHADLRRRAEQVLRDRPEAASDHSKEEFSAPVRELQLREIELQLQSEELHRVRQEAEAMHEKYVNFFELAPVGYLTVSDRGTILEANRTIARLLGAEVAGLRGQPLIRFIVRDDQDYFHLHHKLLVESGAPQKCELRMVGENARPFWVGIDAAMARDSDGAPVCFAAITDISEHKRFEDSLELFRALVDHSTDAIEVLDPATGQFLDVSLNGCLRLGYSRDEFLGLTVFDVVPTLDPSEFMRTVEHLRTSSSGLVLENIHHRKDGSTFPVEINVKLVRRDREYLVAAIRDISERKWMDEQLLLQGSALEAAANAIVITNPAGIIEWANPAFTRLTGYSFAEAVGRNPRELVKSGKHDAGFYAELWATIRSGRVWQGELTNRRKNGSLYEERMTITPVQGAGGGITHFIAIKEDITARLRLEEEFRQAQKLEAVGRLAGGVAHDFNNQLFVINGYCELLLKTATRQPESLPLLQEIHKAAQRSTELTAQLLAFSRKQILQPKVLNLNAELFGIEKMLRRLVGEDIRLTMTPGDDVGQVKVDPGQLQQVVMNLAVNAKDAMAGGGELTLGTGNAELDEAYALNHVDVRAGRYVVLSVSDSGHGMGGETMARVFEPFFTTKGVGKGTGLGLATVHGIVKQSGGHIEVESEPGRGTTFRIYLPFVDAPIQEVAQAAAEIVPGGSETILLVEDEIPVQDVVRRVLEERGYRVLIAGNGKRALELAAGFEGRIHLLLTDVVMPEMGGPALAAALASIRPEMRVVYMSGYADDAVGSHGVLDAGMAFLFKPCPAVVLLRKVRDVLDAHQQRAQ